MEQVTRATIREQVLAGTRYLERNAIPSPRLDAEILLADLFGGDRLALYRDPERVLDRSEAARYRGLLGRRADRVPVWRIIREQSFCGLDLVVPPDVFVPRPETETLVEEARGVLGQIDGWAVDVGTGSGAVALALASSCPSIRVIALDCSEKAVRAADRNARRLGLRTRVHPVCGDVLAGLGCLAGKVALVVSNPPYVSREEWDDLPPEVATGDPPEALLATPDPLGYHRALAGASAQALRPGGWLVVETAPHRASDVAGLFEMSGLAEIEIVPDLTGRDRIVRGRRRGE